MNQGIRIELHFFMISILWGIIILFAYDQFRILRRIIRHNLLFLTIEDLLFWILASVFIFAMIYEKNSGTIRGFSIMGMGIGMILYHYIFSDMIVKLISRGIMILLGPLFFIFNWLKKSLYFIIKKIRKLSGKIYIHLKNRIKSVKISIINRRQKKKAKVKTSKKKDKKVTKRKKPKKSKRHMDKSN
ncbi:MAG: hypothetical protein GX321_03880 [Clostridiales bacterium]|nr:hypothetical protein [Clostridiales bacterium]